MEMDGHQWIVVAVSNAREGLQIQQEFEKTSVLNPVHIMHNGEELLAYIRGTGVYGNRLKFPLPTVVLLDLQMPGASVWKILEEIQKAPPEISSVPLLVLTSSTKDGEIDKAYELGAKSYIEKPFTFSQFLERSRIAGLKWEIVGPGR
jgi:CheY-like chemotaxis protein